MKTISLITNLLLINSISHAQIAIGKETVDGAGILDFAPNKSEGIIIPFVSETPKNPTNGTIAFSQEKGEHYLKVIAYENNRWINLSDEGSINEIKSNNISITTAVPLHNNAKDIGDGVLLGSLTSKTSGVLVLESEDKSLILPKVKDPDINMKSPIAGTICYDTTSKSLAVFNGIYWNYWN